MATAAQKVQQVKDQLGTARIAKDTRDDVDRTLRSLASSLPVSVDSVPNPNVDPEWYSGGYYWKTRDRAEARVEVPAHASVRAVNLDYMDANDVAERRSPSGWSPRVEVSFTAHSHKLVGDLSADQAIRLATELLAAAQLVQR